MRYKLPAAALLVSLAMGLGFTGAAGATAAIQATGAANAAVAGGGTSAAPLVQEAGHRANHRRHYRPRHYQRRHHRHHRRYHHRPRAGVYFHFGTPYRYDAPRYHAPRRVYRLSSAHYRWCEARYRSYRASDNTYNPGKGRPRRQCISPYS